jgi:hypothetical protein
MKNILLVLTLLCAGCEVQIGTPSATPTVPYLVPVKERPIVNIPLVMRQENWLGTQREGSCVWASAISLLKWQGRPKTAAYIRRNIGNGSWPENFAERADKIGLRYAMTTNGDVKFLEWAIRTRRGAAITVLGGAHMVNILALDDKQACILDNNNPDKLKWVPRDKILAEWAASYGWALTPVYAPPAPIVKREQ